MSLRSSTPPLAKSPPVGRQTPPTGRRPIIQHTNSGSSSTGRRAAGRTTTTDNPKNNVNLKSQMQQMIELQYEQQRRETEEAAADTLLLQDSNLMPYNNTWMCSSLAAAEAVAIDPYTNETVQLASSDDDFRNLLFSTDFSTTTTTSTSRNNNNNNVSMQATMTHLGNGGGQESSTTTTQQSTAESAALQTVAAELAAAVDHLEASTSYNNLYDFRQQQQRQLPAENAAAADSVLAPINNNTINNNHDNNDRKQGTPEQQQFSRLSKSTGQHLNLASYGAFDDNNNNNIYNVGNSHPGHHDSAAVAGEMSPLHPQPRERQQFHPYDYTQYAHTDVHPQHDAISGMDHLLQNHPPDAYDLDPHHLVHYSHEDDHMSRRRKANSSFTPFCACLCSPLVSCLKSLWNAESLRRSFCYGAIDGMLTGSGILSAFCGMGLLSASHSPAAVRWLVVVFSIAACFADAVCMALGHVWTTYVLATAQVQERVAAKEQLQHCKADAKGQLVDMLLAKGMLKIDAMSLADTLEGYPDLFIAALTGESLAGGATGASGGGPHPHSHPSVSPEDGASDHHHNIPHFIGDPNQMSHAAGVPPHGLGGPATSYNTMQQQQQQLGVGSNVVGGEGGLGFSSAAAYQFQSYGQLTDLEMDPDSLAVSTALSESRIESFLMLLGFSTCAVVPSLVFYLVPPCHFGSGSTSLTSMEDDTFVHLSSRRDALIILTSETAEGAPAAASPASATATKVGSYETVQPMTLIVTFCCCIMWCLGVWKSRLLNSQLQQLPGQAPPTAQNWLLFGIETTVVLLICMTCAYGLGYVLCHFFVSPELLQSLAVIMAGSTSSSNIAASKVGHEL